MATIAQEIEILNQHNLQFFADVPDKPKLRKVVMERAGAFNRFRYEGRKNCVLQDARGTFAEGARKIKSFDGDAK
jgi:hypothetical protein